MEDPQPLEASKPHEIINAEVLYTATAEDQGRALDECVKWAIDKFVLMSIVWKELDKDGKHVFTISYATKIDVPAQSGDSDLSKSE